MYTMNLSGKFYHSFSAQIDLHKGLQRSVLKARLSFPLQHPGGQAGEVVTLEVKVRNVAAGHNLPTSLTEVRQMWLDVQAVDGAGRNF